MSKTQTLSLPVMPTLFATPPQPKAGYPHFERKIEADGKYELEDVKNGWGSLKEEHAYEITQIEGSIPKDLEGTLYRNGPGLLEVFGQQINNPIDGDGLICAVGFKNGRAFFRNKYVRTEGYVSEQKAERVLHRGVFGTKRSNTFGPSWMSHIMDIKFKNVANTCVIFHKGKLLALWEGGLPYSLDPYTLETLKEDDLGVLDRTKPFGAHTRTDPVNGHLVGFAMDAQGPKSKVTLYEFGSEWALMSKRTWQLPDYAYFHDFAITPNYYVFYQAQGIGKLLSVFKWFMGMGSPGEDWQFDPQAPARIWIMHRPSPTSPPHHPLPPARAFHLPPSVAWHMVNAFEEDGGEVGKGGGEGEVVGEGVGKGKGKGGGSKSIVLDCLRHPSPTFTWDIETANSVSSSAHLTRVHMALSDPATSSPPATAAPAQQGGAGEAGTLAQLASAIGISTYHFSASKSQVSPSNGEEGGSDPRILEVTGWQVGEKRSIELGVSHPGMVGKSYRYVYLVGAPEVDKNLPFQSIMKYDMGEGGKSTSKLEWSWYAGKRRFVGEPIFVPRGKEGDAEDEGWVITLVFDGETKKSDVLILDAKRGGEGGEKELGGAVCVLHLTHNVPFGFHGSFCSEVVPKEL